MRKRRRGGGQARSSRDSSNCSQDAQDLCTPVIKGSVVWAKTKGYPWYPAVVISTPNLSYSTSSKLTSSNSLSNFLPFHSSSSSHTTNFNHLVSNSNPSNYFSSAPFSDSNQFFSACLSPIHKSPRSLSTPVSPSLFSTPRPFVRNHSHTLITSTPFNASQKKPNDGGRDHGEDTGISGGNKDIMVEDGCIVGGKGGERDQKNDNMGGILCEHKGHIKGDQFFQGITPPLSVLQLERKDLPLYLVRFYDKKRDW